MKKILSLLLIMTLVLSMGMVSFAAEGTTPNTDPAGNPFGDQTGGDWTSVNFKKAITTIGNDGALHPAETFNFTITPVSAENEQGVAITQVPFSPSTFNIPVAVGAGEATATVNLPTFASVGTYVYKVQESLSTTAGMEYDTTEYTFTVIVLNDGQGQLKRLILKNAETGQKTDVFNNEYNAGSLVVNKEITGNNANFDETFPVRITLTGADSKLIKSTITVAGNEGTVVQTGNGTNGVVITFDVTNNSNVTIKNIPYGVNYVVEEPATGLKGYTPTYDGNKTGSIIAASIETKIINDLSRDIATGISLDNIPYIILLAGAAIGIVALLVRRRKNVQY